MYKNTPSNQNNSNSEKPKSFFDKYLIEGFVDRLAEFGLRLDTTDEVVSVRRNVEIKEPPLECAKALCAMFYYVYDNNFEDLADTELGRYIRKAILSGKPKTTTCGLRLKELLPTHPALYLTTEILGEHSSLWGKTIAVLRPKGVDGARTDRLDVKVSVLPQKLFVKLSELKKAVADKICLEQMVYQIEEDYFALKDAATKYNIPMGDLIDVKDIRINGTPYASDGFVKNYSFWVFGKRMGTLHIPSDKPGAVILSKNDIQDYLANPVNVGNISDIYHSAIRSGDFIKIGDTRGAIRATIRYVKGEVWISPHGFYRCGASRKEFNINEFNLKKRYRINVRCGYAFRGPLNAVTRDAFLEVLHVALSDLAFLLGVPDSVIGTSKSKYGDVVSIIFGDNHKGLDKSLYFIDYRNYTVYLHPEFMQADRGYLARLWYDLYVRLGNISLGESPVPLIDFDYRSLEEQFEHEANEHALNVYYFEAMLYHKMKHKGPFNSFLAGVKDPRRTKDPLAAVAELIELDYERHVKYFEGLGFYF